MDDGRQRLQELKAKQQLGNGEMQELIRLTPPGTFKGGFPTLDRIGLVDENKLFENLAELKTRTAEALNKSCYIEAISLQLQFADFWLRLFLVAKTEEDILRGDRKTFGQVIRECEKVQLDSALAKRLREFNQKRAAAIHGYLLGAMTYEDLKVVIAEYRDIGMEVMRYVIKEIASPYCPAET